MKHKFFVSLMTAFLLSRFLPLHDFRDALRNTSCSFPWHAHFLFAFVQWQFEFSETRQSKQQNRNNI